MRAYSDVYRARPAKMTWKVPTFLNNDWVAMKLLSTCEELGVGRPFDTAYGAPHCRWVGGRPSTIRQKLDERELHRYFQAYARYGVRVALTFSRLEVDADMLRDSYANRILHVANQYNAQVIVVDDRLADYVRSKYSNVALVASVNKAMCELKDDFSVEVDYYRDLLKRYDRVVMRCECALDDEKLAQLTDVSDRLEYIANLVCVRDCQHCWEHQKTIEAQDDNPGGKKRASGCFYAREANKLDSWLDINLNVPESRICELAERGFTGGKLAGRNANLPTILDTFGTYIFEPTGIYTGIRKSIIAEHRALSERAGVQIPPTLLPRRM